MEFNTKNKKKIADGKMAKQSVKPMDEDWHNMYVAVCKKMKLKKHEIKEKYFTPKVKVYKKKQPVPD